jgi:arylsulfatase A-like enzyme
MAGAPGGPPVVMYVSGKVGLPKEEITWATKLQENGYDTLAVGEFMS